eukprot:CAMPEP_0184502424 /NCGR_PEP_ID=MMETSP0113_2-20130426/50313_1 /TAXON_ID=91329 /ORGANISM="Norrisiella sphaerica, Strain BC52" /LENGTH=538 /DNA_ID=CAMNT_0026891599 /DNA_START=68 /DNA_END=1684 /DNA_ORIENTATION=+
MSRNKNKVFHASSHLNSQPYHHHRVKHLGFWLSRRGLTRSKKWGGRDTVTHGIRPVINQQAIHTSTFKVLPPCRGGGAKNEDATANDSSSSSSDSSSSTRSSGSSSGGSTGGSGSCSNSRKNVKKGNNGSYGSDGDNKKSEHENSTHSGNKNGNYTTITSNLERYSGSGVPVLVQVVHRHGDRAPITPLRNEQFWRQRIAGSQRLQDGGSSHDHWNFLQTKTSLDLKHASLWGRLTQKGASQMRSLGRQVRSELERLMSGDGTCDGANDRDKTCHRAYKLAKVASTSYHRTVMSAQEFLRGFHSALERQETNGRLMSESEFGGQREAEVLLDDLMDPFCLAHGARGQMEDILSQPHVFKTEQTLRGFREKMTGFLVQDGLLLSEDTPHALGWPWLFEVYVCLQAHQIVPKGVSRENLRSLEDNLVRRWNLLYGNERYRHKVIRPFYLQLKKSWIESKERPLTSSCNVEVYSVHDSTVFALLRELEEMSSADLFGVEGGFIPPYASAICLVLLKEDDGFWLHASFSSGGGTAGARLFQL